MQQIKLFIGIEDQLDTLENEVNSWIRDNKVKIHSIQGNIAPQTLAKEATTMSGTGRSFRASDILVLVVYEAD